MNPFQNNKKQFTKSELRLWHELVKECCDGEYNHIVLQHEIKFKNSEFKAAKTILDLAVPELKLAIRVMGSIHGVSYLPSTYDKIQKWELENLGWDVIDVYWDQRPDLWE